MLGLTNPVIGRPDCVRGLEFRTENLHQVFLTLFKRSSVVGIIKALSGRTGQPEWDLRPGLFQGVSVMFRALEKKAKSYQLNKFS